MKPSPKSAITAVKKSLRYAQSVNQEAKRRLYLKHGYKAMTHAIPVVYIDEIGFESSTERRFA